MTSLLALADRVQRLTGPRKKITVAKKVKRINPRAAIVEECAKCVPTNWCDVLLTGPEAGKTPLDCRGVEKLLRGIQDRIRSLSAEPQP